MSAKVFDAMTPPPRGPFFPLRYTRGRDMRKVAWQADSEQSASVQEKAFHMLRNKESRFLESGDTRQTKPAPWSARRRPTHFVALRLPAQCTLRSSIVALNNDIKESFTMAQWVDAFVPLSRLHLTLSVLTIDPETEAEKLLKAQRITAHYIRDWQRITKGNGFTLRSNSLGFFDDGRVAFAKLSPDYDLQLLNKCVKEMRHAFANEGIDIKGNPHDDFIPHITVAKISPKLAKQKFNGARTLPKSLFAHMQWDDLGVGKFHEVDFCSMKPLMAIDGQQQKRTVVEELDHDGQDTKDVAEEEGMVRSDDDAVDEGRTKEKDAFEGLEGVSSDDAEVTSSSVAVNEEKQTDNKSKNEVPYYDCLLRGSLHLKRSRSVQ